MKGEARGNPDSIKQKSEKVQNESPHREVKPVCTLPSLGFGVDKLPGRHDRESMKVALKSPSSRHTLTLPKSAVELLDSLRQETPKSTYIHQLLKREDAAARKRKFFGHVRTVYDDPTIRRETLLLNEEAPVHDE